LLAGKVDPVTALISGVVGELKWSKRCPNEGVFIVAVTRDSTSTVPTRVETVVQVEQPVGKPGAFVTTVPAGLPSPALSPALAVTGGASFNTAPAITTGTYGDTLSTGETRYYKVHLDWGQRLSYQVVVDKISGLDHGSGYARTAIATPLRQELPLSSTSNAARSFGGPESVSMTGSTLVPVQYGNRDSGRSDIRPYSLAGDHYLSVGMSYPVDAVPYRTGISLSVQVVGQAEPGPQYEPAQQSEPLTTSSPLAGPQSSAASGPGASQPTPSTSSTGYALWLWLTVATAVVLAAIDGAVVVKKRSKPTQ
jgi:Ca-activated chloride channel family protein